MPRKIYDIKPPKVARKTEKDLKDFLVDKKITPDVKREKKQIQKPFRQQKKESRSIWPRISIGILIVVLLGGAYLFFKLPKADIIIWPRVDVLSFKQTITADKSVDLADSAKSVVPAKYFQATKTNSQDFPATGNGSNVGQATGTITIYNKYDPPRSFNFVAGTHFMSDSGKLFIALKAITIPAATKSGNKITPGAVQVKIQAVEGGADYNIAPANFVIPGLKGTDYYYSVYATSTGAMAGGYTGKVKKVTDDDIQGAEDVLTKKTTSDAISALKSQISSEYILLDNAVLSNVTSASTQTKSGTVADNFNYSVTVSASALAFKKSDIDQFAKNYILSQMPDGKTLLVSSFKNSYSASKVDVSGGKATLNLDFSSGVYQNVDKNSMELLMFGKNSDQIKATVNNSLGGQFSKMQINFWPFWVTSAPNNQNKVNIELKFQ